MKRKTKALTVTVQLLCTFVFAYAKGKFSHDTAHMILSTIILSNDSFLMECLCFSNVDLRSDHEISMFFKHRFEVCLENTFCNNNKFLFGRLSSQDT